MEAMATELPVISTRVSGIPELVENERTGLLVPEKDARALAGALERLHLDPALATRLGRQGRLHVLERFSLGENVRRLRERLVTAADERLSEDPERRPRVTASPRRAPALSPAPTAPGPVAAQDQAPR
jgi:hypothetical protein